jgi:hypothetical protein
MSFDNNMYSKLILGARYLDDLGHAIAELARWERLEERGVDEDVLRLPEGADEVLARWSVDRRLAADGGVDHREEGSRDLHEADAAHAVHANQ